MRWAILACAATACTNHGHNGLDEPCNGIDDDNDGYVDEGCPCTPFDVTVDSTPYAGPNGPVPPAGMALVWTGDGYVFANQNGNEYVFQQVTADGTPLTPVPFTPVDPNRGAFEGPMIAWNGRIAVTTWTDARGVEVATYDPHASTLSPPTLAEATMSNFLVASVVWAGDRFVLAYKADPPGTMPHIVLQELDATGGMGSMLAFPFPANALSFAFVAATPTTYLFEEQMLNDQAEYAVAFDRTSQAMVGQTTLALGMPGPVLGIDYVPGPVGIIAAYLFPGANPVVEMLGDDGIHPGATIPLPTDTNPGFGIFATVRVASEPHKIVAAGVPYWSGTPPEPPLDLVSTNLDPTTLSATPDNVFATQANDEFSTPSIAIAAGRLAFLLPFHQPGSAVYSMRLIQRCQ